MQKHGSLLPRVNTRWCCKRSLQKNLNSGFSSCSPAAQGLLVVFEGRPENAFWGPFLQEPDFLSQLGSTILRDRQEGVTFCL